MTASISSTSSFISSCLGLDSAQRAYNHYKKSEYTACLQEVAYTVGTLSCVVSLGVLAYACLSSESEKTPSQEASSPFEKWTMRDLGNTLSIFYSIYATVDDLGLFTSTSESVITSSLPVLEEVRHRKVSFAPEVTIRSFGVRHSEYQSRSKGIVSLHNIEDTDPSRILSDSHTAPINFNPKLKPTRWQLPYEQNSQTFTFQAIMFAVKPIFRGILQPPAG